MRLRIFVILCFLLIMNNLHSQIDLQLGPALPHPKGIHLYKLLGVANQQVFSLWVNSRGKNGNDEFALEIYDSKTLAKKIAVPIPYSLDKGKYDVLENAFLAKDRIIVLTSKHLSHQKALYAQIFDLKGKVIKPVFQLDVIDVKTPNNANFYCSYQDLSDVIIVKKRSTEGGEETLSAAIYKTSDLSKVFDKDFPASNFRVNEESVYDIGMKTTGEVYYVSSSTDLTDQKNVKTTYTLNIITPGKPAKTTQLKEDGESFLGIILFYLPEKNIFITGGFKQKDKKPHAFLYSIDMEGKILSKKEEVFDLSDEKRFVWSTKKGPDKIKFGMQYRSMICSGNDVWVVGEQQGWATNGDMGVNYFYYDLIAAHFNLENDVHSWNNFQKREKILTRRENAGSACYMYMKDEGLNLLYLDSKENLIKLEGIDFNPEDLEKVVEHNNSTLVVGKIDKNNKVSRQTSDKPEAKDLHLKCRVVPDASDPRGFNFLACRLSETDLLVFLEDDNQGRWAIAKNVK